jgi:hypothetical protein
VRAGVVALALLICVHALGLVPSDAKLVSDQLVWNQAPYNSFTDLAFFNNQFYLTFREATEHVVPPLGTPGGQIRVLRSANGASWSSAALIGLTANDDMRDPKLSVTPGNQLMLLSSDSPENGSTRQSYTWFSSDGSTFSSPNPAADPGQWLWRVVWHNGIGYGISYSNNETRLYGTGNGTNYIPIVSSLVSGNEASVLFEPNGTGVMIVRRDTGDKNAVIGVSTPGDFSHWTFTESNLFVGGPNIIQLPDGRIVAAGRLTNGTERTSLMFLDPATGQMSEFLTLPSGGDTGYPGLVWHDNELWVSYYGSQSGKASVYVAQVSFANAPEPGAAFLVVGGLVVCQRSIRKRIRA